MFYIKENENIVLYNTDREILENTKVLMPQYSNLEILETDRPIVDFRFADTEEYISEKAAEERKRIDNLTLTPADVERALYKSTGMDFDDLKELISERMPTMDIKALAIAFRAKDFYRGAKADGIRLFDVVGQLLGYTSDDMDYLFEQKELPAK